MFFIDAPTGPDWGPLGIEYDGSDAWVRADARLDRVTNVWLHEYVHTRQQYDLTEATRWSEEGTADYYAALLTFEQGRITFSAFRDQRRRGSSGPAARSVLTNPDAWERNANYRKGALVWGVIDYHIRTAGDRSVDNVLVQLNSHDGPVTATVLLEAVATAGNEPVIENSVRSVYPTLVKTRVQDTGRESVTTTDEQFRKRWSLEWRFLVLQTESHRLSGQSGRAKNKIRERL